MTIQEVTAASERGMSMSVPDLPLSGKPVLDQTELEITTGATANSTSASDVFTVTAATNPLQYYSLYKLRKGYGILDVYIKALTKPATGADAVAVFPIVGVIDGEGDFLTDKDELMGRNNPHILTNGKHVFTTFQKKDSGVGSIITISADGAAVGSAATNKQTIDEAVTVDQLYSKPMHFQPGIFGNEAWPLTVGVGVVFNTNGTEKTFKLSAYFHTGRTGG